MLPCVHLDEGSKTMSLKLGKAPATYDRRDLLFTDFRSGKAGQRYAAAPVDFGVARTARVKLSMLGNGPSDDDSLPTDWSAAIGGAGDCTCADSVNRVKISNALANKDVPVNAKCAIDLYSAITGYDPKTGANDNGANMRDVLNYCRSTGVTDADGDVHKIGGFCALSAGDWTQALEALAVFDFVSLGIEFPQSAMDQFGEGKPWTVVKSSPVDGGHDVLMLSRPELNEVGVATWAKIQPMTEEFFKTYCDEAYGVFMPEALVDGKSPEGFQMSDFVEALKEL